MPNIIKLRRDTATNWSSVNPVLNDGEMGLDTTNDKIKIGDGTSTWSTLPYAFDTPSEVTTKANNAQSAAEATAASALTTHEGDTSTHGVTTVAGLSEAQVLTNKTINGNSNTLTVLNSQTTATSANTASTIVARDASGNFSANLVTVATPTSSNHAATKAYVDNVTAGVNTHASVKLATTAALPTATYANGSSDASQGTGVGATLTATANGALSVDSVAVAVDDRILVKDQSTTTQNGIYTVTATGGAAAPWVLTRATDFDNSIAGEVYPGDFTFITHGTVNVGQGWIMNSVGTATTPTRAIRIGTDAIVWTQFTGVSTITVNAPLTKSGNAISISAATTSAAGTLSAADKTKIDALEMPISFHIAGTLSTGVKQPRFMTPVACTLVNARAYAGGGSGVTYRLVKVSGGVTTTSNTSATVGNAVVTTALTTVTSLAVGDTLQVEIVSAGTSGADLSVTVEAIY